MQQQKTSLSNSNQRNRLVNCRNLHSLKCDEFSKTVQLSWNMKKKHSNNKNQRAWETSWSNNDGDGWKTAGKNSIKILEYERIVYQLSKKKNMACWHVVKSSNIQIYQAKNPQW